MASVPVKRPTVACQLSSVTPIGFNTGVIVRPVCASIDSGEPPATTTPLVWILFKVPTKTQIGTMTLPALKIKRFKRPQLFKPMVLKLGK